MKRILTLFAALAITGLATAAEPQAYRAARFWPGDGPPISNAVLVIQDGKVVAAGKSADVRMPADAVIHDLGDVTLVPGLVVAETTLAEKGRDDLHALTPHYRAADGFDPYGDYSTILAGGVTTVQIAPGGKRLLPGQCSVVKLAGDDVARRLLREEESLRVLLGDAAKSPPRVYEPPVGAVSVDRPLEPTRPQLGGSLASTTAGLRATLLAGRAVRGEPNINDAFLRALATSGTSKKPLRVTVPTAAEVHAALALAKELDLKLILVDPPLPTTAQIQAWKAHVIGVVLDPGVRPGVISEGGGDSPAPVAAQRGGGRRRPQPTTPARGAAKGAKEDEVATGSPAEAAKELRAAGIRVAIKPVADADLKDLLYVAGLFTTHNDATAALKMLTADSAALLGVNDRVGSLTVGKDADFVVLTGEPFALHTRVKAVYVDGQPVHDTAPAAPKQKVIRAGRVLTGTGDVIPNGAVLVDGKTIRAVGRDVSTPGDAEEKNYRNAVIVPGFIDLANGIGVGGAISSQIPINTKLGQRLVVGDPAAALARQGGVTTVLLSSSASPSPVVALKLGDKLTAVKDPVAFRLSLRGNLTSAGPQLRESLKAAKDYHDKWIKYDADYTEYEKKKKEFDAWKAKQPKPEEKKADDKKDEKKLEEKKPEEKKPDEPKEPRAPTKPQSLESLEPLRELFAGKVPVLVEATREDAIRLAVTICRDEYNLRTVLVGATDAYRMADWLAEKQVAVAAGPELVRTVDRTEINLPMTLAMRGIAFGFQSQATGGARNLPLAAGYAVRRGLGAEDALRGLTAGPAKFLGLDNVGTLATGKDADLVVLSGMPFELSTRVLAVMIDGQWVYQE